MGVKARGILSPVRLPIPPLRQLQSYIVYVFNTLIILLSRITRNFWIFDIF